MLVYRIPQFFSFLGWEVTFIQVTEHVSVHIFEVVVIQVPERFLDDIIQIFVVSVQLPVENLPGIETVVNLAQFLRRDIEQVHIVSVNIPCKIVPEREEISHTPSLIISSVRSLSSAIRINRILFIWT